MPIKEMIDSGEFVILGEFQPPKGADFSSLLKSANQVRGRVSAIVVPELAVAVLKASSLGGCAFLQNHGFETVFQICPRDRNRLALQADILSAAALGVPNVMVVAGEDVTHGDHHLAREVRDLDMIMLFEAIKSLQGGKDMAGHALTGSPDFFVGTEINTGGGDRVLETELEKLKEKMELGVEFIVTGPVFDPRRFKEDLRRIDTNRVAVMATVLVLKSAGMARYVDRNVKNISIPPELIKRLEKAAERSKEGLKIAGELIARFKDLGLAGVLVSTRGWDNRLPQILDAAGL